MEFLLLKILKLKESDLVKILSVNIVKNSTNFKNTILEITKYKIKHSLLIK